MKSIFRCTKLVITFFVICITFLLNFVSVSALTFEIENDCEENIVVTVHCSDQNSCDVFVEEDEETRINVSSGVAALEINGTIISSGTCKTVTLISGSSVFVDFTDPNFAGIFDDDDGD